VERPPRQRVQMTFDAMHRPLTRTADGATTPYTYPDKYTSTATTGEST
jgi:hypothetical protein